MTETAAILHRPPHDHSNLQTSPPPRLPSGLGHGCGAIEATSTQPHPLRAEASDVQLLCVPVRCGL